MLHFVVCTLVFLKIHLFLVSIQVPVTSKIFTFSSSV